MGTDELIILANLDFCLGQFGEGRESLRQPPFTAFGHHDRLERLIVQGAMQFVDD